MKLDMKTLACLKRKGVSPEILIDMLLEEDPQPESVPDPEPEAPAPEVQSAPAAPEKSDTAALASAQILAAIEKLTGAVQARNIRGSSMEPPRAETADDILKSVLAGPGPEGGK